MLKLKSIHGSNNILYPKEEKDRRVLLFACRNCEHEVTRPNPTLTSHPQFPIRNAAICFFRGFQIAPKS